MYYHTTSVMAGQVGDFNVNNTPVLENAFNIKEEECQNDDFTEAKCDISESVIIIDNPKLKYNTLDNIKLELLSSKVQRDGIYDNIKTEDGISPNDIKIEFNNGFLYCEDCHVYCEEYCAQCGMLVHILNRTVPIESDNTSQDELPNDILEIQDYFGESHILALKVIPVGVKFGPFTGLNRTEGSWKIKGGKFVVNKDKSSYLNWMQYINAAKNVSEQNLLVFQYEHNLYYESTCKIEKGDELLVYLGEKYEDSLHRNIEMDFIPITEHSFKDVFACTFCCLGFSSKSYLIKHKTICSSNADGGFSIDELMQCLSCKIYLDQKEYVAHHIAYCGKINNRKCVLPIMDDRTVEVKENKIRPRLIYKCQQCKYSTKYKGDLSNHTNLHYEVKMYKCGVCCRRFKTKEVLKLHVENTRNCAVEEEDWKPSIGDYLNEYIKPELSHPPDEVEQFKCSSCDFRTKYKISLKTHMGAKHLKEFKYKCDRCDYKTHWQSNLKKHIEGKHLREFKYKCGTCDYKANLKYHLNIHINTRHLREFKYKCDTCDYKTNRQSLLKMHIKTKHLKEFKYKCVTCDYKSNQKYYLNKHTETKHSNDFKHKCDTCNYKSNSKSALKRHIDGKHLKVFKYRCDTCEYKANRKSLLDLHVQGRHAKEFKYKCDACEFKTNRQSYLKTHIEGKHLKEFKFKCDACNYKSNFKSDLQIHIEGKHLKEFMYKCDTCEYKTNRKAHLRRHIEGKHLKELKYKCDTCEYKSNWKSDLKKHVERKHLKELKRNSAITNIIRAIDKQIASRD